MTDKCPKCDGALIARKGKYGDFFGCSNFPECKYTAKRRLSKTRYINNFKDNVMSGKFEGKN